MFILIIFSIYFIYFFNTPKIYKSNIVDQKKLNYPSEYNYRQTLNNCGPYNTSAIVRSLTNEEVSSEEFSKNIKWRLSNNYTLPWGLERQLKENNIKIKTPNLRRLDTNERLNYIKEQLSLGNPLIILGEKEGIQHYISIFGFNSKDDKFNIYDPLYNNSSDNLTKDDNLDLPGNTNYNSQELISFWENGGLFGFYKWYIITSSK